MEMSGKGEGNENQSTRKGVGFKQNGDVVTIGRRKRHVAVTWRAASAVVTGTGTQLALQGRHPCCAEEGVAFTGFEPGELILSNPEREKLSGMETFIVLTVEVSQAHTPLKLIKLYTLNGAIYGPSIIPQ